ncbi:helix-turn-helix transcriptional regulator [Deinococcus pimensis]|uniref:helix-turn-helix transcriptional regulator n=1 Tax=Deinococcus pimensis TaxID=309888 RepID=UPI0004873174|nr:helix-turn-helix transcriptional regulator [Deinococcus pimensis]
MSAPDDALTVTDERAAAFLTDPATRVFVEPFLGRDASVTSAARAVGVTGNTMLYRVRQMRSLGLLRVTREVPRRGRAVRMYRAVADRLFVPYTATSAVNLREVMRRERAAHDELLLEALLRVMSGVHDDAAWGMLLYRSGEGVYAYDAVHPEEPWEARGAQDPAVLDYSMVVHALSREDAKALQRELREVLARYLRGVSAPGGGRYVLRVAMAPLGSERER